MKNLVCARFAGPFLLCAFPLAIFTFGACARSQAPPATPASYAAEALVIEQLETTYKYNDDGTGTMESQIRMKVQNEAGARQFSVITLPFAAATQKPQVLSLLVHHPDGTSTETPAKDAIEMPAPVTQQAPLYSDLKTLQIPVRSLRAGDTLEYRVRIDRRNPESPSQFWDKYSFTKTFVVLSEKLTLDVPAGKYVQQWSDALKPTITENAGRRVFVWTTSQLKPTSSSNKNDEDDKPETPKSFKPDVAWTTFHSWAEVGEWYRSLAASRAAPNDAIRAQADEITREAKTPEEQVQALYAFVSSHIRYIGIDFGVGRYQPHAATEVLATQYGDCKDKDTLFEALLHAKGISASPALIGVNLDLIPELPSPAVFNHVITTVELPSGRVWTDSTPGVAPYRFLIQPLRDKPALLIPSAGNAVLEQTPKDSPFPFVDRFEAVATLTKDGELNGQVNMTYRSDSEIFVRAIAMNLAPAQWDQGTQLIANALGFSGTTSNSRFDHPEDVAQPMHLSYDYNKKPFGDWDNFRIVPLFPVVVLPAAPSKQPSREIDLGSPRTQTDLTRIHLPEGYGADLPDAVHVKTPFVTFDKTYKFDHGDLIVERNVAVLQGKLPPKLWEDYKKFASDVSLGNESWIQITSSATSGTGSAPPKPGENNPAAAALIDDAVNLEQKRDWPSALKKLDAAKKLSPEQPFLWSNYGFLAMVQNRPDEAKTGFAHELAKHPDEAYVVKMYASFLMRRSETGEALSVLKASYDRDSTETGVAAMLASLQANDNHMDDAIATLRKTQKAKPDDTNVLNTLGNLFIRAHRNDEAAEIGHKLLTLDPQNADLLNNGAYVLAEADNDLASAEQASRKSLELLDNQTSPAAVSEANQQSFNRTSLIVASWDTLGYVLFKEKKFEEAIDYFEAAWRNRPDVTIGLHYGQALEAVGKTTAAQRVYVLSASQFSCKVVGLPDWQPLQDSIARLKAKGISSQLKSAAQQTLQDERTFKINLPAPNKSFASAIYRLQLSSSAEPEVIKVSGEDLPESLVDAIRKLSFPHLVPSTSKARILRNAAVTCSAGKPTAYVVLMPLGGIAAEHVGD